MRPQQDSPQPDMPGVAGKIRLLIVDDHPAAHLGLARLLQPEQRFHIVGHARARQEVFDMAVRERPDVILLNLQLANENWVHCIACLRGMLEQSRILVYTTSDDPHLHQRIMLGGAHGILLRDQLMTDLARAIECVHRGEVWIPRSLVAGVFAELAQGHAGAKADPAQAKIATLTEREREVVALLAGGLKNKAIAERLFVSESTVRNHLTTVFAKLEVADRLELGLFAIRYGLAPSPNGAPPADVRPCQIPSHSPPCPMMVLRQEQGRATRSKPALAPASTVASGQRKNHRDTK